MGVARVGGGLDGALHDHGRHRVFHVEHHDAVERPIRVGHHGLRAERAKNAIEAVDLRGLALRRKRSHVAHDRGAHAQAGDVDHDDGRAGEHLGGERRFDAGGHARRRRRDLATSRGAGRRREHAPWSFRRHRPRVRPLAPATAHRQRHHQHGECAPHGPAA